MRRDAAEKIISGMRRIDEVFGELDAVSHEIDDEVPKKKIRRAMATLVLNLYKQITMEVVRQFPDSHPDKQ